MKRVLALGVFANLVSMSLLAFKKLPPEDTREGTTREKTDIGVIFQG